MKSYKPVITLNRNSRGCYILDTIKGCSGCNASRPLGCYDNCYAQNIASRYRFDFSGVKKRDFERDDRQAYFMGFQDTKHEGDIVRAIKNIDMPFVRIGEMGDPSEDWAHTIEVCKSISIVGKPIVIITKHWNAFPSSMLSEIEKLDLCVNTSISALDSDEEIEHRLNQHNRLKPYCKSVLRVVSCDFDKGTEEGTARHETQERLFQNDKVIDTVFRPYPNNPLVTNGIINVEKVQFLRSTVLSSRHNKNAYLGKCDTCPEMCGINL